MPRIENLNIKIFADGADLKGILEMKENPLISGFTTNPTLMRKAGVANYEVFARKVLEKVTDRFKTKSGRRVLIEIYVEPGKKKQTGFALTARSEERRVGKECSS